VGAALDHPASSGPKSASGVNVFKRLSVNECKTGEPRPESGARQFQTNANSGVSIGRSPGEIHVERARLRARQTGCRRGLVKLELCRGNLHREYQKQDTPSPPGYRAV
jgi:hypothetical protein